MEEIGVDPMLLGNINELRKVLLDKVDGLAIKGLDIEKLNEKQLIDKLIEGMIEPKCHHPSFIMNHPLLLSPLAKTHA